MRARPLLIVGLDAGEPEWLLRWARAGTLPALSALLRDGAAASLESPSTVSLHEIWTSVFSGVPLHQHGYYARRALVPGTYRLEALRAEDIKALPFWSELQRVDGSALVVDVPDAPIVPGLRGFQILGWGEHPTPARVATHPPSLLNDVGSVGHRIPTRERHWNRAWDRRYLRRILARIERKRALCRHLLRRSIPDATVVVFGDAHAAGHQFSKYHAKADEDAGKRDSLGGAMLQVYQAIDAAIADVIGAFPETPNIVVVTNSGIRDGSPLGSLMPAFCNRLGYTHVIRESPVMRVRRAYRRVVRTPSHDLGRVDWSRTRAFVIPADHTGYIRVNVRGREPAGIVSPGAEYESVLDALESDLHQLVDTSTGAPAVERTVRASALTGGGAPDRLPDLFVEWRSRPDVPVCFVHPRAVFTQPRGWRARDNTHSQKGLVIAAGPAIPPRSLAASIAPVDLAPWFLDLVGLPPAAARRA